MSLVYYLLIFVITYAPNSPYKLKQSEAEFDAKFQTMSSCVQSGKGLIKGLHMLARKDNFETKREFRCTKKVYQIAPQRKNLHNDRVHHARRVHRSGDSRLHSSP